MITKVESKPDLVKHHEEENSQYEGKPLLKPRRPYKFKYEYRLGKLKGDQSLW